LAGHDLLANFSAAEVGDLRVLRERRELLEDVIAMNTDGTLDKTKTQSRLTSAKGLVEALKANATSSTVTPALKKVLDDSLAAGISNAAVQQAIKALVTDTSIQTTFMNALSGGSSTPPK
jgi:hypothetical protein